MPATDRGPVAQGGSESVLDCRDRAFTEKRTMTKSPQRVPRVLPCLTAALCHAAIVSLVSPAVIRPEDGGPQWDQSVDREGGRRGGQQWRRWLCWVGSEDTYNGDEY
ncbi:hypothetical protein DPEC_G00250720 [Dallia pectoralis]|uniref:Uncharacterized protein n=1 Tax=Dallia pectoralis TaxID=75939 RepID=A0ACC2FT79_DALPE|nr:hypothetical protein DPEC_G00250720 [Dallia pectoralis]